MALCRIYCHLVPLARLPVNQKESKLLIEVSGDTEIRGDTGTGIHILPPLIPFSKNFMYKHCASDTFLANKDHI